MIPYDMPPPPINPSVSERMAAAHFRPQDIGMEPGISGMGRSDYQTWLPSNVLMELATRQMAPQAQAMFRNRKLNRQPSPLPQSSGAYMPNGEMYVARSAWDGSNPYPTDEQQVGLARHEILHGVQAEMPRYSQDMLDGLRQLIAAIEMSGWTHGDPSLDPSHFWIGTAENVMQYGAPPPLRDYFSGVLR